LFISISYVTIKIGLNIEVMKVVFQAHDIRGWGSFKVKEKLVGVGTQGKENLKR
jgi:hypothetical protein